VNRPAGRDYRAEANQILEDVAGRLSRLLSEMAGSKQPFPFFPGSITQIVEVEPPALRPSEAGFIGVAPDGAFYEYVVTVDPDAFISNRKDTLKPVELNAAQYIQFAMAAIDELSKV
jgi:hypothetical protein